VSMLSMIPRAGPEYMGAAPRFGGG
jgi:hypothetical protein